MIEQVVIVGGGIAGSAAALALRRADIAVTILETRPAINGGAIVRLNPNAIDALRAIGAHQPVIAASFPLLRFEWYAPTGRIAYRLTADPSAERGLPRVMAWADLAQVLHEQALAAGAIIRHDAQVTDIKETSDGVQAVLVNGDTVTGDALVGADGAHSTVRTRIDPEAPPPSLTGRRTVYGFTPQPASEPPPPEVLRAYVGSGFLAITRDSFTGGCYWFTSLPAPNPLQTGEGADIELWRSRLIEVFGPDSVPAAPTIRGADRILAFDDYALQHLPHWHSDRMAVIGDAAHVAPPGSEQGAAMAIEDGVVLAQCLRDATKPAAALATFERRRRQRAQAVVALGLEGIRHAHAPKLIQLRHWIRNRLATIRRRRLLNIGGRSWALDHHIDWHQHYE